MSVDGDAGVCRQLRLSRTLSPRERQCLELVGVDKDDRTIAALVGIRPSTAHNTVQRAMKKYGVATRTQAVVRALSECEITLDRLV